MKTKTTIWIGLSALALGLSAWFFIFYGEIFVWGEDYDRMLAHLNGKTVTTAAPNRIQSYAENFTFLDTRSKEEFGVSHIKNALYVGYHDFSEARVASLDRSQATIVYCSVGYRSEKIGRRLQEMGFEDVRNLYGGIFQWVNDGLPVYNSASVPTDSVHGYSWLWAKWVKKGEVVY